MKLSNYLLLNRKEKNIRLFFDIETLQYNEDAGKETPSEYKNVTYSVGVSYYNEHELELEIFPTFKHFLDTVIESFSKWQTKPKIEMIAHNNNKYDNHYFVNDLLYYYPHIKVKNMYLKNANEKGNALSLKHTQLSKEEKEGTILEKRIKSSNNLEVIFFLNGIQFHTTDNYMKTNVSVATLGHKLKRLDLINEDELKTDFNYTMYNKDYDMTDDEAREYALEVHNSLSKEQIKYIENDVIILAKSVYHYSKIFKGFDYNKITFTSNILEFYNDNDLTSFQLLKKVGEGKKQKHIKYTDYKFANENFYDYLKPFYSGGLNMYNQKYLGKIISEAMFSIDINSSYPYAMHNFKVPTFLREHDSFEKETIIDITYNHDIYSLYRMTKQSFDYHIIDKIDSKLFRQILVKYYSKGDFININTYTLRMIENVIGIKFDKLPVTSYVNFDCEYFGSRDKIEENYFIKTQGSNKNKIIMHTPYNIEVTDIENKEILTREEVDNSKVLLNGLYGIPALRPYFNLFRIHGDSLENVPNGYKNSERNIVFSIFVTSVSLYNLLDPLKYLTQTEIDENLVYTDTDSLYIKSSIRHKFPNDLFDPNNLGKWDIQDNLINHFYVLNHKKYAYEILNEDNEIEIIIKSGGISHESFDKNMSFEKFIETQFSDGVTVKNLKSIYNNQKTISLYESETELSIGQGYRMFAYDESYENQKRNMFKEIRNEMKGEVPDLLYIESSIGTFSLSELYPVTNEVKNKLPLLFLEVAESQIKEIISN